MGRVLCVEFQSELWNSTKNNWPIQWKKNDFLYKVEYIRTHDWFETPPDTFDVTLTSWRLKSTVPDCMFNNVSRQTTEKIPKLRITGHLWGGIYWWLVVFIHKRHWCGAGFHGMTALLGKKNLRAWLSGIYLLGKKLAKFLHNACID